MVRGRFPTLYTDAKTRAYEATVSRFSTLAMKGQKPFTCALEVDLRFRLAVPASYTKKRRLAIFLGTELFLGSFDVDNLAKSILDGMNEIVFADDKQVIRLSATKEPADNPGVDVIVRQVLPREI